MTKRASRETCKKLSAIMKRRRADPGFIAAYQAGMQRLHADPEFAASNSSRMQERNAEPAFRAKQRASRAIPDETRRTIVAALRADPNPYRVARAIDGASYSTVLRIAKAAGIATAGRTRPRTLHGDGAGPFHFVNLHVGARLRWRRKQQGMTYRRLAEAAGICLQQIRKYEYAVNRISPARLYHLAQLLDVPVSYFFEGLPPPGRPSPGQSSE
jgi:hypothetical protein